MLPRVATSWTSGDVFFSPWFLSPSYQLQVIPTSNSVQGSSHLTADIKMAGHGCQSKILQESGMISALSTRPCAHRCATSLSHGALSETLPAHKIRCKSSMLRVHYCIICINYIIYQNVDIFSHCVSFPCRNLILIHPYHPCSKGLDVPQSYTQTISSSLGYDVEFINGSVATEFGYIRSQERYSWCISEAPMLKHK